ncbi:hypothetical protein D3C86_2183170 [compost metagenome]
MMRVCYLFPVIVFLCVMAAIYWENEYEKPVRSIQDNKIQTVQTASSAWEASNNLK